MAKFVVLLDKKDADTLEMFGFNYRTKDIGDKKVYAFMLTDAFAKAVRMLYNEKDLKEKCYLDDTMFL